MGIACIARCIGVAAFAASLQVAAQPPAGKGKPEHAGVSPFIRFPVPQQAVDVMRNSHGKALAAPRNPAAGAHGLSEAAPGKALAVGLGNGLTQPAAPAAPSAEPPSVAASARASKPVELALGTPTGGSAPSERKAPAPECGTR